MRKVAFAAFIAFSVAPALASDLDNADLVNYSMRGRHYSDFAIEKEYDYECGPPGTSAKKCKVKFESDRLSVNGSKGITQGQILHYSWDIAVRQVKLYIVYLGSDGNVTTAGFASSNPPQAFSFTKSFLNWMNNPPAQVP